MPPKNFLTIGYSFSLSDIETLWGPSAFQAPPIDATITAKVRARPIVPNGKSGAIALRSRSPTGVGRRLRIKIKNNRHIVAVYHRVGDSPWTKFTNQFEVSGYHHNVAGDFLSLRPAVYAAGTGEVRIRDVRYTAI